MINEKYFLDRLAAGESIDDIGKEIADMMNDMQVLSEAQKCARSIIQRDPQLVDPVLRGLKAEMRRLFASTGGTVTL